MKFLHCVFLVLVTFAVLLDISAAQGGRKKSCRVLQRVFYSKKFCAKYTCTRNIFPHGTVCNFECENWCEYKGGNTEKICENGKWEWHPNRKPIVCQSSTPTTTTTQAPEADPEDCSEAPMPEYTTRSACRPPFQHGERCVYRCRHGYVPDSGSSVRICQDGEWTGTDLVCVPLTAVGPGPIVCPNPPRTPNTFRRGCRKPYTLGEMCTYRCRRKKAPVPGTNAKITCGINGWIPLPALICRDGLNCQAPPNVACANRRGCFAPFKHCERCNYRCKPECTEVGGDRKSTCDDGAWVWPTGNPLVCKKKCKNKPQVSACAKLTGCNPGRRPFDHGTVCNFQCNKKECTKTGGDDTQTCDDGNWVWPTGKPLVCKKKCKKNPQVPACAELTGCDKAGPSFDHGAVCNLQCKPECPKSSGDDALTCDDGNWNGDPIVCDQMTNKAPMVIMG